MTKKKTKQRPYSITIDAPSLTQQHQKEECDINNIMARYIKTGVLDHVAKYQPQYTDNKLTNYHESMNTVIAAETMFSDLPSQVRKNFNNDPGEFLKFVQDENNHTKLVEMGLTNQPIPPSPQPTPAPEPLAKQENQTQESDKSATAPETT